MNILAFTSWVGVHDTAAAVVRDGVVVAAAEEERFSRVKHESRVPLQAIEFCLSQAGLTMREVDVLAFPEKPYRTGPDSKIAAIDRKALWRLHREGHARRRTLMHHVALRTYLRSPLPAPRSYGMDPTVARALATVREAFGSLPQIRFFDHHEAHAALAYYASGLERAAVATVDGRGDPYATVTWAAEGRTLRRLRTEPWSNSLGFFYRDATAFAGLGEFGEGKMMGLAAYGDPGVLRKSADELLDTRPEGGWYRYRRRPSQAALGFPARDDGTEATDAPYPDFAAAVQDAVERALDRVTGSARKQVGTSALCLGGGVALNCAANGWLAARDASSRIDVFAASGDAGLPIGAALLAARDMGDPSGGGLDSAYLGPEFSDREIERALVSEPRLRFAHSSAVAEETAELLAAQHVVGWFQGRLEIGPRALGNRSILADPRSVATRDRVNRLKGREPWRPLAPAVHASRATEFFELARSSPFMLFAAAVRPHARERLEGVVHADGTCRPQTVEPAQNARLHELLDRFERRSGLPVLLNTSFNDASEPIVCTPSDAIRTFLSTGLDDLVLGDYIASKRR